ncbi:hypothetical protein D9M71_465190 [compost metagenome]
MHRQGQVDTQGAQSARAHGVGYRPRHVERHQVTAAGDCHVGLRIDLVDVVLEDERIPLHVIDHPRVVGFDAAFQVVQFAIVVGQPYHRAGNLRVAVIKGCNGLVVVEVLRAFWLWKPRWAGRAQRIAELPVDLARHDKTIAFELEQGLDACCALRCQRYGVEQPPGDVAHPILFGFQAVAVDHLIQAQAQLGNATERQKGRQPRHHQAQWR